MNQMHTSSVISLVYAVFLFNAAMRVSAEEDFICDNYLAPSLFVGSGVGVFGGRHYVTGELLEPTPMLSVRQPWQWQWQMQKYSYEGWRTKEAIEEPDYADLLICFGTDMVYNHHDSPHLLMRVGDPYYSLHEFTLNQMDMFQHLEAYSVHPRNYFEVLRDSLPGEEIFFHYGDTWFENKGIPYKDPASAADKKIAYTLEELAKVGHCASYLRDDTSTIADAGVGMFARKFLMKGELIQVSPLLIHSKFELSEASDESSVAINYCISRPDSDVALLPILSASLCNHGGNASNAVIEWFFWSEEDRTVLDTDANELCLSNAARLYLGYRATRDIEVGEEVTIDYGEEWQREWEEYLEKRKSFKLFEEPLPLFRRSIDAPEGLFPPHWAVECIGSHCEMEENM